MSKRNLKKYEISYLVLMSFIMIQVFLIFTNVYNTQEFSIESFTIVIVQLISILLSYFVGLIPAAVFSVAYVIGYVMYIIKGENDVNLVSYILMFFVPLTIIYAGNMNRTRGKISNDLVKLNELEEIQLKMDPFTSLENEYAFKEVLSKHSNLAYRYPVYYFSVFMFRLEFIDTMRTLLDTEGFNELLEKIASIIQKSIREEDYKFTVSKDRFVIITPMTSKDSITIAVRRIIEGVEKIDIKDRNGDLVNIVLKAGGLDYSKEDHDMFKDSGKTLLELEKTTEVDIYGEYAN